MILFMAVLAVVLLLLQRYTAAKALHRVYYKCETSKNLVDPEEKFTITTTVENQKNMMVPFMRMLENFPPDIKLHIKADEIFYGATDVQLTSRFYMMPNQIYTREMEATLPNRGCRHFRNALIYGGDYLGLEENEQYYPARVEIVVMPTTVDCPFFDKVVGDYLGDISVNRFILEDPVLTAGFREYTGREPMRSISWTQSSRVGKIMVKNYDHTLDLAVTIVLNIKVDHLTEESVERIENCYRMVRSVCEQLEEKRIKYNFFTNATIAGFAGTWSNIGDGLGDSHFRYVMEGLGRAVNYPICDFSRTLYNAFYQAERSHSFIIVSPYEDEEWMDELYRLRKRSMGPVCILTPDLLEKEEPAKADFDEEVSA